ncbi:MAG: hypothetical protein QM750_31820 [Rubrivivax sp.]
MNIPAEISLRDLSLRPDEIIDAVEHGRSFTVTRDGRGIGQLIPLRRRRFISREAFAEASRSAPSFDPATLRADLDAAFEQGAVDPYAR